MLAAADILALELACAAATEYRNGVETRPIGPVDGFELAKQHFGGALPDAGVRSEQIIADLIQNANCGLMGLTHPRFLGWVTGASHPVGVAADWLTAAWGQNAPSADVTPAAAAAEEVAGTWIKELLGLPEKAGFGFTTGATMANTIALATARNALLARAGWDVENNGLYGAPEIKVVVGAQMHSTVYMGLRLLGFGAARVIKVAVNADGRMDSSALRETLAPLNGPILVIAQAGHINSGAIDPLAEIAAIAKEKDAWVHVDGAFGLWARACPDLAHLAAGAEECDSWATDGHKWLQTPYDTGFVFVRNAAALNRAMTVTASYLPDAVYRDPGANTPELSRRARGFAVWAVLRALGRDGVARMIAQHCKMARQVANLLNAEPGLKVLNDVTLNQVALCCDDDKLTETLLRRVQADGQCYPSGAVWQNRPIIRLSFSSGASIAEDAEIIAGNIIKNWQQLRGQA